MKPSTTKQYARPSHPFRGDSGVLVIAHRGGGLCPENTLKSFQSAVDLGVDVLEPDVHLSRDGHLVLAHDDELERVSNGTGLIRERTLAQLKQLDMGYCWQDSQQAFPFRDQGHVMPTLSEVLTEIPEVWVNIDIKDPNPALIPKLTEVIRAHGAEGRVLVGSFFTPALTAFRQACPEVVTSTNPDEALKFYIRQPIFLQRFFKTPAVALQIPDIHEGRRIVTPRLIRAAHQRNLAVHVWTINEPEEMKRLIDWGVDGIVTDYPDRLLKLRK